MREQEPKLLSEAETHRTHFKRRIFWDNEMLGFLEERHNSLLSELRVVEGQITTVKLDKAEMWKELNGLEENS